MLPNHPPKAHTHAHTNITLRPHTRTLPADSTHEHYPTTHLRLSSTYGLPAQPQTRAHQNGFRPPPRQAHGDAATPPAADLSSSSSSSSSSCLVCAAALLPIPLPSPQPPCCGRCPPQSLQHSVRADWALLSPLLPPARRPPPSASPVPPKNEEEEEPGEVGEEEEGEGEGASVAPISNTQA